MSADFLVFVHPANERDIRDMVARAAWQEYYRAVRVLRRLRQQDKQRYRAMSRNYWRSVMHHERPLFNHYGYDT